MLNDTHARSVLDGICEMTHDEEVKLVDQFQKFSHRRERLCVKHAIEQQCADPALAAASSQQELHKPDDISTHSLDLVNVQYYLQWT